MRKIGAPGVFLLAGMMLVVAMMVAGSAFAATYPNKPSKENWYVDNASLLTPEAAQKINSVALKLFSDDKVPLYVVTIRSLADYDAAGHSVEGYATDLFNKWGIGSKDRNYGMLLLVSVGDRKARIELGAGWGHKYDRQAKNIMADLIVPAFKRGDFSTGIVDGVRGLDALARGLALPKPKAPWWFLPLIVLVGIGLVALIYNLFKTGRSGWAWALIVALGVLLFFILRSAAQSGGSGGGFGGGSAGGGGATGSW